MKKLFRRLFPSKEMRAYHKMYRRHRKELMKLAKEDRDFDWCWLDEFVRTKIKHMYEYFSDGNNVWQTDESLEPIVESLKHILDLYDELDHLFDTDLAEVDYGKGVVTVRYTDDTYKTLKERYDREMELYKEIYSYIGCKIMYWWD